MEYIQATDGLELQVVATGMHMSPRYGNTYKEIEKDGFDIDQRVDMLINADSGFSMAKSTGIGMMGLAEAFRDLEPDVILVLGDRDEPLAAGIAAAHMNIPVAHIHGGDVMVGAIIDDSIRYALTKFAHVHFPASEASAERISRLGEEEWRITVSGAPGLDAILDGEYERGSEPYERDLARMKAMWQSRRDFAHQVDCCLRDDTVSFDIFYGVSDNRRRWLDLEHARSVIGYDPRDDGEDWHGPDDYVRSTDGQ